MVNKIGLIDIFSRLSFNSKKEILDKIGEVYPVIVMSSKNRIRCRDENGETIDVLIGNDNGTLKIKDFYILNDLFIANSNEMIGFKNDIKRMSGSSLFKKLISYNELIVNRKDNTILVTKRELIIDEIISRRKE